MFFLIYFLFRGAFVFYFKNESNIKKQGYSLKLKHKPTQNAIKFVQQIHTHTHTNIHTEATILKDLVTEIQIYAKIVT